jgi:thymidylate synthase ThyX
VCSAATEDPFIPIHWGKNQKGMQAEQELTLEERVEAQVAWLEARDRAVESANRMLAMGIHKQITNRILEPWLWHTVIVTSTEWENWNGLRRNKDAQPEIRRIADMLFEAMEASSPSALDFDEWHLPLVDDEFDLRVAGYSDLDLIKICIGRCTRVSYLTHDGIRDPKADIELCERLLKSGHMSPFEHAARQSTAMEKEWHGNFRGWVQARKLIKHEDNFLKVLGTDRPFELKGL